MGQLLIDIQRENDAQLHAKDQEIERLKRQNAVKAQEVEELTARLNKLEAHILNIEKEKAAEVEASLSPQYLQKAINILKDNWMQ